VFRADWITEAHLTHLGLEIDTLETLYHAADEQLASLDDLLSSISTV
jgi:hypothetical protein